MYSFRAGHLFVNQEQSAAHGITPLCSITTFDDHALNFFFATNDTTLRPDRRCRFFAAASIAFTS
jgi:hypothetical protein